MTADSETVVALVPAGAARQVTMTVMVKDLTLAADIGVHDHEIGRRQVLVANVALEIAPVHADRLSETIDYREIVRLADALAAKRTALIETFAQQLAADCMAHPGVLRAEVSIDKPGALERGIAAVRVVMTRA
jgi:dihydroneopterin aldolase